MKARQRALDAYRRRVEAGSATRLGVTLRDGAQDQLQPTGEQSSDAYGVWIGRPFAVGPIATTHRRSRLRRAPVSALSEFVRRLAAAPPSAALIVRYRSKTARARRYPWPAGRTGSQQHPQYAATTTTRGWYGFRRIGPPLLRCAQARSRCRTGVAVVAGRRGVRSGDRAGLG